MGHNALQAEMWILWIIHRSLCYTLANLNKRKDFLSGCITCYFECATGIGEQ